MSDDVLGALAAFSKENPDFLKAANAMISEYGGDVVKDLIGIYGGDALRVKRLENCARILKGAQDRLKKDGIIEIEHISLSVGLPLLEASQDESREEIIELWVQLLAAAMDPRRAKDVRYSFIEAIKKMDPTDALVFNEMSTMSGFGDLYPSMRNFLSNRITRNENDIEVSFNNLMSLGLAHGTTDPRFGLRAVSFTVKGRELVRILKG